MSKKFQFQIIFKKKNESTVQGDLKTLKEMSS